MKLKKSIKTPLFLMALFLLTSLEAVRAWSQTTISGTVTIEGKTKLENIEVTLPTLGFYTYTDFSGRYVLDNVPQGAYEIFASSSGALACRVQGLVVGANPVEQNFNLIPGELKRDGEINLLDILQLVQHWQETSSVPTWDETVDLKQDGAVDTLDLQLILDHWHERGQLPPTTLIDDCEDGDRFTLLGGGSYWMTQDDSPNGGNSSTEPAYGQDFYMTASGFNGSQYCAHYSYTLRERFAYRYCLMRANMTSNVNKGIDASSYAGISFWLKGSGHQTTISLKSGPTSDDWCEYEVVLPASPLDWMHFYLLFKRDFTQPSWGGYDPIESVIADLHSVQFKASSMVIGESGENWVDDLRFINVQPQWETLVDIKGKVVDHFANPIRNVIVSVASAPGVSPVLSLGTGMFYLKGVPVGHQIIKLQKTGFGTKLHDIDVKEEGPFPVPIIELHWQMPLPKPESTGPVKVVGQQLLTDFDGDGIYQPYTIKGVGYAPTPIGSSPGGITDPEGIYGRDFPLLEAMNCNTIRTWGATNAMMLDSAQAHSVKVIAGFWVDYGANLADPSTRLKIIESFRSYVRSYKDHPALLMWSLGNEQNYQNGNNPYWYDLVQELAVAAYQEEGASYHPVTTPNGELANIGIASKEADDGSMSYLDLWGANIYRGKSFGDTFTRFASLSAKPLWISEYGIDALDNRTRTEYPDSQAVYASALWDEMEAAEVCIGGTIMAYSDEWWKAGDPNSHDYGGYPTSAHPDGFSNEEWWGIFWCEDNGDAPDILHPRQVYYTLRDKW